MALEVKLALEREPVETPNVSWLEPRLKQNDMPATNRAWKIV